MRVLASKEVGDLKAKVGLDTVEFNKGITILSKQMSIVREDFKLASGSLDKVKDSMQIAQLKTKSLSDQIELQKKIVDDFKDAHAKVAAQFGESSKQALDYELKLKKSENTLQGLEKALKQTTSEISNQAAETAKLQHEMDLAAKQKGFEDNMTKLSNSLKIAQKETESSKDKITGLTNQLNIEKDIIKQLDSAYQESIILKGQDAKETQELKIKLLDAQKAEQGIEGTIKKTNAELASQAVISKEAQKKLEDMSKTFDNVGKKMSDVGSKLSIGLTVPILAAGVASVKFASDMSETINKIDVVFGDSADSVKSWSNDSIKSMGLAGQTALDSAALYGDMGTAMGFAKDEAAKMGMQLTQRAADMASFKNIRIDIASTAMSAIFTGETESLKAMGVVMTEANLQDYAMRQGITKTIKEMTQAEKVNLRYAYVMDMTSNSQGDFIRTGGGVANQTRMVQENIKQLGASIGEELLPTVADLLKEANKMISGFSDMSESQKKTVITVLAVAAAIGPLTTGLGKLSSITGFAISLYTKHTVAMAAKAAATVTDTAATTAAIPATVGFGATVQAALGPILLVGAALAAGAIIYRVYNAESIAAEAKIKTLKQTSVDSTKAFNVQTSAIKATASMSKKWADELYALEGKQNRTGAETAKMNSLIAQLNEIMPDLNLTINKQTGALNLNKDAVLGNVKAMKEQALAAAYVEREIELYKENITVSEKLATAQGKVRTEHTKSATEAKKYGVEVMGVSGAEKAAQIEVDGYSKQLGINVASLKSNETAQTSMTSGVQKSNAAIVDSSKKTTVLTKEQLDQQKKDIEAYQKEYERLSQEHTNQMGTIFDKGIAQTKISMNQVKENLKQQVKDFSEWRTQLATLSSKVPADVFAAIAQLGPGVTGLIKEMNGATGPKLDGLVALFQQKFSLVANTAARETSGMPEAMAVIGKNVGQSLANGVQSKTAAVKQAALSLGNATKPSVSLYSIGANVGQSYANGINSRLASVKKAAQNLANTTTGQLSHYMEIRSLSKVMMGLGGYVSEGFAKGITDNIDMIKKASRDMAAAVLPRSANLSIGSIPSRLTNALNSASGIATPSTTSTTNQIQNTKTNSIIVQNMYVQDQGDKTRNLSQLQFLTAL